MAILWRRTCCTALGTRPVGIDQQRHPAGQVHPNLTPSPRWRCCRRGDTPTVSTAARIKPARRWAWRHEHPNGQSRRHVATRPTPRRRGCRRLRSIDSRRTRGIGRVAGLPRNLAMSSAVGPAAMNSRRRPTVSQADQRFLAYLSPADRRAAYRRRPSTLVRAGETFSSAPSTQQQLAGEDVVQRRHQQHRHQ